MFCALPRVSLRRSVSTVIVRLQHERVHATYGFIRHINVAVLSVGAHHVLIYLHAVRRRTAASEAGSPLRALVQYVFYVWRSNLPATSR